MALITHQVKGSYPPPIVKRTDVILLKHSHGSCLCVKAPLSRRKSLKISAFKGNVHNDEAGHRDNVLRFIKNSVKLSYVPQNHKETVAESPELMKNHATPASDVDRSTASSQAIQYLFRSWLTLLRTSPPNEIPNNTLEALSLNETVETDQQIQNSGRSVILRAVWHNFVGLDAAIKIPSLIFIPMYLAVNVKYGSEVAKEMTPLWIGGPLLVALYIKIIRGLCLLYIYSFKQSVKVVNNLPIYYDYVRSGRLKETIYVRFWKPVVNFRNLGYKGIWKNVQEWLIDKYLDYIESIWPHYCKLIRFLKRANFI